MKLVNVIGNGQKYTLSKHILFAPIQIPPEIHIFFYDGKTALCLYAPIHSELCTILRCDPFQSFLPPLFHHFGDVQPFVPFLHRCLAVVAVDTLVFMRTSLTAFTFVDSYCTDIAVPILTVAVIDPPELLSV